MARFDFHSCSPYPVERTSNQYGRCDSHGGRLCAFIDGEVVEILTDLWYR